MWKVGLAVAASFIGLLSSQAQAAPVPACTSTMTVASGDSVPVSTLLTPGTCVDAGDKTFGNFADTGFSNTGSATFVFASTPGNVTLSFLGALGPSATGTLDYAIAINPALAGNFKISDIEKDFTLNAADGTGPATGTLTGTTVPLESPPLAIDCTRTDNPETSTCPSTNTFAPVLSLTLDETLTVGANSIATALTDTVSQTASTSPVPEPATLTLIGSALLGLGALGRRRRR